MPFLTFAFCTYNRADRLPKLVEAMRAQSCPVPFEILAINNNSSDHTAQVLADLERLGGAPLRWVTEPVQGIVAARNRGIAEALNSDILVYIDDDEIPLPGLIHAAADAILNEGAESVGGRVEMDFTTVARPAWLEDNLLGFLAAVDHGPGPFWIQDESTPVWTANVAYDMRLFRDDLALRFDKRFDRVGNVVGGGSDGEMFRTLLKRGTRMRYRPDMAVLHSVEPWRLKRRYFLQLHYRAGRRRGQFELPDYHKKVFGVPPFMFTQTVRQCWTTGSMAMSGKGGVLRQAMNAAFAWGAMVGYGKRP
ncbi:MAG: glycosyltransferase [Rubrivivax sp.]|nr:glycosyltransferase [Rubrivivax sp.]